MPDVAVTVLICTRDRPKQLERCLESILKLDYRPMELLVVDNASKSFHVPHLDYPIPIRFYRYTVPGLSQARNAVLPEARGEILALIDDDAVADSGWLNAALPHFQDPTMGCVTGKILPLQTETVWQQKQVIEQGDDPKVFDRSHFDPVTDSPGKGANLFIRKASIATSGFPRLFGPGTSVYAADEHYLFHQIIQAGWKICYEPAAIVYHDFSATEKEYRERSYRRAISRGAFLSKFLFTERGYRIQTLQYLFKRLIGKPGAPSDLPTRIRNLGLILGPFALGYSALHQRYAHKSAALSLVKDVSGGGASIRSGKNFQ